MPVIVTVCPINGQRRGFIQVVRGSVDIAGQTLVAGDAIMTRDEQTLRFNAIERSELLFFDMA